MAFGLCNINLMGDTAFCLNANSCLCEQMRAAPFGLYAFIKRVELRAWNEHRRRISALCDGDRSRP